MSSIVMIGTWGFSLEPMRRALQHEVTGNDEGDGGLRGLLPVERAVVGAVELVEQDPDVHTVGNYGFPAAHGKLQLDAAVMCCQESRGAAPIVEAGAVAGLENYAGAIRGAMLVCKASPHTLLVGTGAEQFLDECSRSKAGALQIHKPHPSSIRVTRPAEHVAAGHNKKPREGDMSHDTVGIIAVDVKSGSMCAGCSSSGMRGKQPGRVGDSPICGSGVYLEAGVGAAVATGDGDTIATFPLAFMVLHLMKNELSVQQACEAAINMFCRLPQVTEKTEAAVCSISSGGEVGAACTRCWTADFRYVVVGGDGEDDRKGKLLEVVAHK